MYPERTYSSEAHRLDRMLPLVLAYPLHECMRMRTALTSRDAYFTFTTFLDESGKRHFSVNLRQDVQVEHYFANTRNLLSVELNRAVQHIAHHACIPTLDLAADLVNQSIDTRIALLVEHQKKHAAPEKYRKATRRFILLFMLSVPLAATIQVASQSCKSE